MGSRRILVVDDERNMQAVLKLLFEGEGWDATCVSDGSEALALLEAGEEFGVIVSDLKMDRVDGIGLLRAIRERGSAVPFVLITAFGTVEKAVEAMKLGAIDVVTKPFAKEIILAIVSRVFRMASLEDENEMLRAGRSTKDDLVYRSPAMRDIVSLLDRIGPASSPVLITGESGTGKEVAARSLHRLHAGGDFDARPFVSVNCPAVPETLLESELFGYRKGAFTGADRDYKGRVELARGGTLFFDEIGDLPLSIQPKILRLLENRSYEPPRQRPHPGGRHPHRLRDKPQPQAPRRRRPLSRRPSLSHQHLHDRAATPPRASRGHRSAGPLFSRALREGDRQGLSRHRAQGPVGPGRPRLARQFARTQERDRKGRRARKRPHPRPGRPPQRTGRLAQRTGGNPRDSPLRATGNLASSEDNRRGVACRRRHSRHPCHPCHPCHHSRRHRHCYSRHLRHHRRHRRRRRHHS